MPDERHETRLDIWLWTARFFKTRGLARVAIEAGRVELGGARCKPSRAVHVGDRLRVSCGHERMELDVLALASRCGPASEAQLLYRETEASREAAEALREQRRLSGAALDHPARRPDRQARRQLRKIKDLR
jgi:ribosome-associated heat shock protein Hsp15